MYSNFKSSAPDYHYMYRMYGFHMPLFNQIHLHPCSPALPIQKTILVTQGDNARRHNLSSSDRNCGHGIVRAILRVQKGGRFAHTRWQGPLRAALKKQESAILSNYIVYISFVSIYFVIITTLDVLVRIRGYVDSWSDSAPLRPVSPWCSYSVNIADRPKHWFD